MNSLNSFTKGLLIANLLITLSTVLFSQVQYTLPGDWNEHEGTWLVWPHDSTYGPGTRDKFEPAWIEMTRQLVKGENVHIVAYSQDEQDRIVDLLTNAEVPQGKVNFYIHPNDDYWIRDNGPIFVKDASGNLFATDWGFNGWGNDAPYLLDDQVPSLIASDINMPAIDLSAMILEGGAAEVDGNGTLLATKSSITGDGRNHDLTDQEVEDYLTTYLGITNFIWLDGKYGGNFDITDTHVDGFAKFLDTSTIVTMRSADLSYWFISQSDRDKLFSATNVHGNPYNYVYLPLTDKVVKTTWGASVGSKGSYINYYVGNSVVLVPTYEDANDSIAIAKIQGLYPDKEAVGIDCRNMFYWGGMVHCVTQQQPLQACSLTASVSPAGTITACKGTAVTLTCENADPGISYQWRKNGIDIAGANDQTYINSKDEANFDVIVSLSNDCSDLSNAVLIDRIPKPKAIITPLGDLDICNTGTVDLMASSGTNYEYQWKKGAANIAGATNQIYTATAMGKYKVEVTHPNGCSTKSKATSVISSCKESNLNGLLEFAIYPNPASDVINISMPFEEAVISITNSLGAIVMQERITGQHQQVDLSNLAQGIYAVRIISGDVVMAKMIVKD